MEIRFEHKFHRTNKTTNKVFRQLLTKQSLTHKIANYRKTIDQKEFDTSKPFTHLKLDERRCSPKADCE